MSTKTDEAGQKFPGAAWHGVAFPQAPRVQQRKWPTALLAVVACWTGALPLQAQTVRPWVWIDESPSIPPAYKCGEPHAYGARSFNFIVGCYDASTGEPLNCETLYTEYFSLEGVGSDELLVWTGGHNHENRSTGDLESTLGSLYCPLDQGGGSDLTMFHGFTNNQFWQAVKSMPEASGVIRMTARYTKTDPMGYWIPDNIWHIDPTDPTQARIYSEVAFRVQVTGLEELPDSDVYQKVSKPGDHTPHVFFGTPEMNQKLALLAQRYRDWYQSEYGVSVQISFNDLSLPYGGLYDINGNWACPHVLHRLGRSADVNRSQYVLKKQLDEIAKKIGLVEKHRTGTLMHYELP